MQKDGCKGPGVGGEKCGRPVRSHGYCVTHAAQKKAVRSARLLEPGRGPSGQFLVEPRALPIMVSKSTVEALAKLGAKVPVHPTDKRRKSLPLRGLRHLALALEAGGVKLVGEWKVD